MRSGVYQILNTLTGKMYIGSSKHLMHRFNEHRNRLERGAHHSLKLQHAWNKYGRAAFQFSVIEYIECVDDLFAVEQFYIDVFDAAHSGYNVSLYADVPRKATLSVEHRAKIAAALRGRVFSPETRAKISAANKGRVFNAEVRAKFSASHIGLPRSAEMIAKMWHLQTPEARKRISDGQIGRIFSPETRAKISAAAKKRARKPNGRF